MVAITGMLALAILGGEPARAEAEGPRVQVRLLEMKGLEWRSPLHAKLHPAGRQGTSTIWTAPREVIPGLVQAADRSIAAPTLVTRGSGPASVQVQEVRHHVADVVRVADGPPGENSYIAFRPDIDQVRDGLDVQVACRPVERGTSVRAEIRDQHLTAMQTLPIPGTVKDSMTGKETTVTAQIQVPMVVSGAARGEWVVGRDEALIVSLGAFTTSDDKGRAVVRERLAVVEPHAGATEREPGGEKVASQPRAWKPAMDAKVARAVSMAPAPVAVRPTPPMPLAPTMIPLVASPKVAPAAPREYHWKATLRLSSTVGRLESAESDSLASAAIPLLASALPFPLKAGWLAVSVEPIAPKADAKELKHPTPPTRALPTPIASDGRVVPLPPLPDDDVQPASTDSSGTPRPAPQSPPVAQAAESMARVGTTLRAAGGRLVARTGETEVECEEMVLYPAPRPTVASGDDCHEEAATRGAIVGTSDVRVLTGTSASVSVLSPQSGIDWNAFAARFRASRQAARVAKTVPDRTTVEVGSREVFDYTPTPIAPSTLGGAAKADPKAEKTAAHPGVTTPSQPYSGDDTVGEQPSTLNVQVNGAGGSCEYDSSLTLRSLAVEPVTLRVPLSDGRIIEIQAKVVKGAKR